MPSLQALATKLFQKQDLGVFGSIIIIVKIPVKWETGVWSKFSGLHAEIIGLGCLGWKGSEGSENYARA